jgi:transcriptional regulator with XRE-family HTH domain
MPRRVYPNLASYFRDNPDETLTKVADELGISLPYLSMIKWGSRQPSLKVALDIAERCHVPLESLTMRKAS